MLWDMYDAGAYISLYKIKVCEKEQSSIKFCSKVNEKFIKRK